MRLRKHLAKAAEINFASSPILGILSGFVLVAAVACSGENSDRRSAVDTGRLCNSESKTTVAGACLDRGSNIGGPAPDVSPEASPVASPEASPVASPEASPVASPEASPKASPVGGRPAESLPGGSAPPTTPTTRTLVFMLDSFVAVADTTVAKNCFIPSGTTIEFSGELAPLTQFRSLGVNQNIAFNVVAAVPPSGKTVGCELKSSDIVYLVAHADAPVKP